MNTAVFNHRISTFQNTLKSDQIALVLHPHHLLYLIGYKPVSPEERELFLVVSPTKAWTLATSFIQAPTLDLVTPLYFHRSSDWIKLLTSCSQEVSASSIQVSLKDLSAEEYKLIKHNLPNLEVTNDPHHELWKERMFKRDGELELMRQANHYTAQLMQYGISLLQPGITEQELAQKLKIWLFEKNCTEAFPSIVAFGANSALAHHAPTGNQLQDQDAVLIDIGARRQDYCGDMTRSFWYGSRPTPAYQQAEELVLNAYTAGLQVLQNPGSTAGKVDESVRAVFTQAGQEKMFIHSSGHGLGISVHEPPSIYYTSPTVLEPGMVITLEPGLYYPGSFGIRHENSFLVNGEGVEVLTEVI